MTEGPPNERPENLKGGTTEQSVSRPSLRAAPARTPTVGDQVALRKGHPCGVNRWELLRLSSDAALRCTGCGRVVVLEREPFLRSIKQLLTQPISDSASSPGS